MSDTTNDIDALLEYLGLIAIPESPRYHAALTALVAERDALVAARDGYLEGNRQTLRALAEANEIAARYKRERDEARGLIRKWWMLLEIVDDGEIMYAKAAEGQRLMDEAEKRAFLEATRKEGGGA